MALHGVKVSKTKETIIYYILLCDRTISGIINKMLHQNYNVLCNGTIRKEKGTSISPSYSHTWTSDNNRSITIYFFYAFFFRYYFQIFHCLKKEKLIYFGIKQDNFTFISIYSSHYKTYNDTTFLLYS